MRVETISMDHFMPKALIKLVTHATGPVKSSWLAIEFLVCREVTELESALILITPTILVHRRDGGSLLLA